MNCLVLAAGRGSRLSNKGQPKPLVPFLGLTLIERAIFTANICGINNFFVVSGYQGKKVRDSLDRLAQEKRISINHIINEQWDQENGLSVLKARDVLKEPFLLIMCDHLVSEQIIKNVLAQAVGPDQVLLAVDYNPERHPKEVIAESTKVQIHNGKIIDIGKQIPSYNALDCGVFLCTPVVFEALEQGIQKGDSTLSAAIRILAEKGQVLAVDIGDAYWYDIDDEKSYRRAEKGLLETLKKSTDGPVSRYINRPLSLQITHHIVNKAITPNAISMLSFLISLGAAMLMSLNSYMGLLLGAVFAQVSSIVDGCDGEVARLRFEATEYGGWLDSVLDRYADAALITGLGFHILHGLNAYVCLGTSLFALAGTLINSYTADKYDKYLLKKFTDRSVPIRLGRDVRVFMVFIGGILNQAFLTLLLVGTLMNLENVRRILVLRWER